jgi:hypothetical protein
MVTAMDRERVDVVAVAGLDPKPCGKGLLIASEARYAKLTTALAKADQLDAFIAIEKMLSSDGKLLRSLDSHEPFQSRSLASKSVEFRAKRIFMSLLEDGLDPCTYIDSLRGPLVHEVASTGWVEPLIWILDHYPQAISLIDKRQETLLHVAAQAGASDAVRVLLERGAVVESRERRGHTALWRATLGQKERIGCYEPSQMEETQRLLIMGGANAQGPAGTGAKSHSIIRLLRRSDPRMAERVERMSNAYLSQRDLWANTAMAANTTGRTGRL